MTEESLNEAKNCLIRVSSTFSFIVQQKIGVTHPEFEKRMTPVRNDILLAAKIITSYRNSAEAFLKDPLLSPDSRANLEAAKDKLHETWALLAIDFTRTFDVRVISKAIAQINEAETYWNASCSALGRDKCALLKGKQVEFLRTAA